MDTLQLNRALGMDPYVKKCYGGTLPMDQIQTTRPVQTRCWVLNLSPSTHPGTHWVAVHVSRTSVEYFCSYGLEPPGDLDKVLKRWARTGRRRVYDSNVGTVLQTLTSDLCGEYCVLYLKCRCRGVSFREFLTSFTTDTGLNDEILKSVGG